MYSSVLAILAGAMLQRSLKDRAVAPSSWTPEWWATIPLANDFVQIDKHAGVRRVHPVKPSFLCQISTSPPCSLLCLMVLLVHLLPRFARPLCQ